MASQDKAHPRFSWRRALVGSPLETQALAHQTVSKPIGLAVFASDALSSTAYATQEILIILAYTGLGASVFGWSIPIAIAIALLLVIVTISYRQTIFAYPNGGGAYIVARDNLGELPAQIAGAALLTDYILTVSVSISNGVEQIASGIPALHPWKVELALLVIVIMTVVNLRGVKESGSIFAVPTYFFLGMMFVTLAVGAVRFFTGDLPTIDPTTIHALEHTGESLGLFLILKAFSSGCTALTGVEAISNGITAFKEPRSRNAAMTLTWMSSILIVLFLGITFLSNQIQAIPSERETIISQLGTAIYGDGTVLYFLMLAGTALILLMAANTSYADFPRLAALAAGDGFLPRQLTFRGSRLVFSWGIVLLAGFASALVVVAGASTTALIPLYAIGVFLSFTISQSGMAVRFWKAGKLKPGEKGASLETAIEYDAQWRLKMGVSAFGAVCTFIVMIVFAVTKFTAGAWFVVVLIPALVWIFFRIHSHYKAVAVALSMKNGGADLAAKPVQTIILVDGVHRETARIVRFAKSLGHPWRAVHVAIRPEKAELVKKQWQERIGESELEIIPSPYRHLAAPIREYVEKVLEDHPGSMVHVIMGHLAMDTFWEQALHQNSALIFNVALGGMENVVMTSVPYQIHRTSHGEYFTEENHDAKVEAIEAKPTTTETPHE